MKPTERYAAVALLLLVALVIVVGFWDTGEPDQKPVGDEILAGRDAVRVEESARPQSRGEGQGQRPGRQGGAQRPSGSVPLSGSTGAEGKVDKVTTRQLSSANHRVTPGAPGEQDRGGPATVRVEKHTKVAQSPDQLAGTMRPGKRRGGSDFDVSFGDVARGTADEIVPSGPFLSRTQPKKTREPVTDDRATRLAAKTSVEVASTRKKEALELKKAASDPTLQSYKVKSGDALIRIAKRECGSDQAVAEIVRLNGLVDSDIIFAGMVLKLPSRASTEAKIASSKKTSAPKVASSSGASSSGTGARASNGPAMKAGRRKIRIQSGDVLGTVLERELGTYVRSIALVRELNPGLDPGYVQVGQEILLPARSEVPKGKGSKTPSRAVPASARRTANAPRLAANTASTSRAGRNSNSKYIVR